MKLLFDRNWLMQKIESDPDIEFEAGPAIDTPEAMESLTKLLRSLDHS